ncbi:PASTA domain-containing protein [Curtobacterium sp. MCBD17_040]|uniref:PASTA domain-containing protein n=1 Tax=Curtobacterium sp. MCBD17_040 TaxID=2175674 RepID=UPI0011B79AC0|nr:PASTA domain-containing protein [Curtobacterium sp. MCBD17_040]WIB65723.1 PASTA domain-containing protein [Curtobacterium sp. MCBD17_040]
MERAADRVIVPNVVGLPFHVGRDVAHDAGVVLANSDPDGPPIGALAWPGLFYITSQRPAAGAKLYRWDSVVIEVVAYGEADSTTRAPFPHEPPVDSAHAHPTSDSYVHTAGVDDTAAS